MEVLIGLVGAVSLLSGLGWAATRYGVDSRTSQLLKEKGL
jgi:hypothetical protein